MTIPRRPRRYRGETRRARDWADSALALGLAALLAASWSAYVVHCAAHGLWGRLALGLVLFPFAIVDGLVLLARAWL